MSHKPRCYNCGAYLDPGRDGYLLCGQCHTLAVFGVPADVLGMPAAVPPSAGGREEPNRE